jgi:hypothetical protein
LLSVCLLHAQVPQYIGGPQGYQAEVFKAKKYLVAAPFADTPTIPTALKTQMIGTIVLRMPVAGDTAYWGWIGYKWIQIGDGGGGGGGSGTVTSFSAGNLSPLFTSNVATATTTPALTFSLTNTTQYKVFGRSASGSGAPSYIDIDTTFISGFSDKVKSLFNAGYGLSYANGTYSADSFLLATRARVKHVADSLAALLALPSQTGNSGKYLTTNGTTPSWGTVATNADSTAARIRRGTYAQRPAVPDTGQVYWQTDRLAGKWEYDGAKWNFLGTPANYYINESFNVGTGASTPKYTGLLQGAGAALGVGEAVGVGAYVILNSGTTTTGYCSYGFSQSGTQLFFGDSMIMYHEYKVRLPILANGTEDFQVALGYLGHQSQWGFSPLIFYYNYNVNGGKWQVRTRRYFSAGDNCVKYSDTGVSPTAGVWQRLGIEIDGYANVIRFYIDDVLVVTHTGATDCIPVPSYGVVNTGYNTSMVKLAGTTNRTMEVDHVTQYVIKKKY